MHVLMRVSASTRIPLSLLLHDVISFNFQGCSSKLLPSEKKVIRLQLYALVNVFFVETVMWEIFSY